MELRFFKHFTNIFGKPQFNANVIFSPLLLSLSSQWNQESIGIGFGHRTTTRQTDREQFVWGLLTAMHTRVQVKTRASVYTLSYMQYTLSMSVGEHWQQVENVSVYFSFSNWCYGKCPKNMVEFNSFNASLYLPVPNIDCSFHSGIDATNCNSKKSYRRA